MREVLFIILLGVLPQESESESLIPVGNADNSAPTSSISIPEVLRVGEHIQADLKNISLDDVAKGRVNLEIYPKGKVTVFSNISFITRKPEIILFPREAGSFWLVFVLHNEKGFSYIDVPFEVVGDKKSTEEKVSANKGQADVRISSADNPGE